MAGRSYGVVRLLVSFGESYVIKLKGKSILYRYLISFVSIAMVSCALVGMISYLMAARELKHTARQEQTKRLMMAVEDVSEQIDQLQEIAYRVQTTVYYRPAFIGRNPYYEIELLNDFKKYSGYSSLVTEYFLRYEGDEMIFCHDKKSYLFSYMRGRLGLEDTDALAAFLDSCEEPAFYPMPEGTLAVFPIHMGTAFGYTGRACVCFYLADEALLARARLVSGEPFERMALRFDGEEVVSCGEIAEPTEVAFDRFSLVLDEEEIGIRLNDRFLRLNLYMIAVFAMLLCTLAVYAAVRNYRPIGNLAKRYNLHEGEGNELEYLDRTLGDMEGQLRLSQEELDARVAQFKAVRGDLLRHFVLQMVHGYADEKTLERMREAGVHFPETAFQVYMLRTGGSERGVERTVCELSDDDAFFYAVPYGGANSYAVLVNAPADVEAGDILREVCTDAEVYGGMKTEMPGEISGLLFDAMAQSSPSCIRPSDIARCREDKNLRAFRKALEVGDESEALRSLREYCAAYVQSDQTMQQLIQNNVIAVLLGASYEANLNVPRAFLRGGSQAWSMLEGWVSAICGSCETTTVHEEHEIIRYLREHALDYSLSLESVAEYFRRSTRQISRIIQAETGCGYKEFTLRLRMEHAKDMLRAGKSVEETSEAVCYASRSHFIKTFTGYAGMTPSKYRDQQERGIGE